MDRTLEEIRDDVALRTDWTAAEYQDRIVSGINAVLARIYTKNYWPALYNTQAVTATLGQGFMSLPAHMSVVTKIHDRDIDRTLTFLRDEELVQKFSSELDQGGPPTHASWIGTRGVSAQPSAATALSFISSNAGDLSQTIKVTGLADGIETEEEFELNGTATVTGTRSFSEVFNVAKDSDSDGYVDLYEGSNRISRIPRHARAVHYPWLRLNRTLEGNRTYYVTYRRRTPMLIDSGDVPILPDIGALLTEGSFAHVLRQQRDYAKASVQEGIFQDMLEAYADIQGALDQTVNFAPDQDWLTQRRR